MGKLNQIQPDGNYATKLEIMRMAVEILKNSNWAPNNPEDVEIKIKTTIDQLTKSYNEL